MKVLPAGPFTVIKVFKIFNFLILFMFVWSIIFQTQFKMDSNLRLQKSSYGSFFDSCGSDVQEAEEDDETDRFYVKKAV